MTEPNEELFPLPAPVLSSFAVVRDERTIDYYERERLFDRMEAKLGITVEELGSA